MNDKVDVLAVMDDRIQMAAPMSMDDLREARAAVAKLIEAMNELLTHTIGCEILLKIHATETVEKAKAALARVKGE